MRRKVCVASVCNGLFLVIMIWYVNDRFLEKDVLVRTTKQNRKHCVDVIVYSCSGFQMQKKNVCVASKIDNQINMHTLHWKAVKNVPQNVSYFKEKKLKNLNVLLNSFVKICKWEKIPFLLYGGSLLGTYRHHGKIPWDDDVDVIISANAKRRLRHSLDTDTIHSLNVRGDTSTQWKVFRKGDNQWPFIDVFFYDENKTHIWDTVPQYRGRFVFYKSDIFPVVYRLFNGLCLPVPRNIRVVLEQNYDIDRCQSPKFDHFTNSKLPVRRRLNIRCVKLYPWFPFVFHDVGSLYLETLKINNSIISYHQVNV